MKHQPNVVVVGSINMDLVVEADRPPKMGETVSGQNIHFIPGGKGANQAVAAARLGAHVAMIGTVGRDAFGSQLTESLTANGVHSGALKVIEGTPTGVASILLAQGDNSIIVVPGANACCLPEDVEDHHSLIEEADVVLLQLEIPIETVEYAADMAKRCGKKVILNPAPARQLSDQLLANIDVIIPNESELALLSGIDPDSDLQLERAMRSLLDKGIESVITTLGAKGAAYMTRDGQRGTVPGYKVQVVDTTGAGDSFNAAVACSLAMGKSLADAVSFANQVAALAVTKLGAQQGMPTRDEVSQFKPAHRWEQ
ncbi:ribokinase [Brevibacillus humidisoli]|uniref:ribokinase n=1 Tax=Brevibacillus humidisoli TaxID=2895522 RepID=UPI001E50F545|nr:ribokinase [Brevibacillus humidisoli]UFJ41805.1 ribokinase [Brevibacillus humidisoli]